jgi:biopolymer transport protein ExbD
MAKFGNKGKKEIGAISTASLPDIVFMILFFFMVTTSMREEMLMVEAATSNLPNATEIKKLERKSLVSYIYVGKPRANYQKEWGTEPKIQINGKFVHTIGAPDKRQAQLEQEILSYVLAERSKRDEAEVPYMTTSLKVNKETKMGIVTDIKQALRKASALKINYSSRKKN